MMRCRKAQLLLDDYLRGALPSGEMEAVAEHLVSCPKCDAEAEFLKRYHEGLSSIPAHRAPEGFLGRIREGIASGDSAIKSDARRGIIKRLFLPLKIKLPLEAAGLLATAALVFVLVKPTLDESMRPAPSIPQQNQEIAAVKSPDRQERSKAKVLYHAGVRAKKTLQPERIAGETAAPVLEIDLAVNTLHQNRGGYAADSAPGVAIEEQESAPASRGEGMDMARSRAMKSERAAGVSPARQATVQFTSAEQIVKIKRMIRPLGGRIIGENSAAGEKPAYVRVELPEANYARFVDQLNQVGQVTRRPAQRAVQNRRSVDVQVNVVEQK